MLKYYDDQSEPATGVRLYERLINEDKVDVIMGPYGTAITAPAANVAERYKMPMICPETADVAMFQRGFKYIFQGLGPVQTYLYGVLQIAKDHKLRTLALIGPDTAFAHSLVNAVPEVARGFGQSIVYTEFYPARASDFSSVIEKVQGGESRRAARDGVPQRLDRRAAPAQTVELRAEALLRSDRRVRSALRRERRQGRQRRVLGYGLGPRQRVEGERAVQVQLPRGVPPRPRLSRRQQLLGARGAGRRVKRAGSLDHDKLRDAISDVRVSTLIGNWRIDPRTGIQFGYTSYILQWQNGKQVIVYPGNVAHGKPIVPFPAWAGR